jgi:YVTN family beta-propeller protein
VHELCFSPDGQKYFVTCQKSNTVNVMNANTDQFITSIPVGIYPQEFGISADPATPYLYVVCMEDTATYPGNRGSVYIINWQTNTVVGHVNSGYQPHGITIDDDRHLVLIANRNAFPGGPAPHHASACGGKNGYITYIDMFTNQLMTGPKRRLEVAADPYAAAYRR